MLELSPVATEPLDAGEQRMLGLARQEVSGNTVQIALRAMASHRIAIRTWRSPDGSCTASAETTISGVQAALDSVYVKLTLFGLDHVLLTGKTGDGATVEERISL